MDWSDVAKLVVPFAPALGGVLGGFLPIPGGALAGQAIGGIIARTFGVNNAPGDVVNAISNNPNEVVLAKLTQATEIARAEIEGFEEVEKAWAQVAMVSAVQVNKTMQVEYEHQHWFFTGWRPACGWVLVAHAAVFGIMLNIAAFMAAFYGKSDPLKILTDAWPLFLAYFGALAAVVGVAIIGRSQEKAKAIETGNPLPGQTVKPVVKPTVAVTPVKPSLFNRNTASDLRNN